MNKAVAVTGGTKGIGRAIITLFADKGFDIITCSRSEADLAGLKTELENKNPEIRFEGVEADISTKEGANKFVDFAQTHLTNLLALVNNTGVFIPGQIHQEEDGVFEKTMNTNVSSAYYVTRGLIHNIMNNQGHIFNICSTASITPYINGGSYCVSKYALLGMTKVLREEMKEHDVKVTAIIPGATLTESWEGTDLPEERFMNPEDVAHAIWSAFSMSERSVVEEVIIRPQLGDID
ncbi:MAG: SDR family oxidoreductase [Bacteroidota bacterium]